MMWKKSFLFLFLLGAFCWEPQAQEFGVIYENLDRLNGIIESELRLNESMRQDNESLNEALRTLEELSRAQGELLAEQERNYQRQREICERQAVLLGRHIRLSKNLRFGLLVGIPAAAGAGALIVWAVSR